MTRGQQKSRGGQVYRAARIQDRKLDKNSEWPQLNVFLQGGGTERGPPTSGGV